MKIKKLSPTSYFKNYLYENMVTYFVDMPKKYIYLADPIGQCCYFEMI